MRTVKQLAQEALEIQNASNLSGVVHSFSRAMTELRENNPNRSTEFFNTHPIAILFIDKLCSLARMEQNNCYRAYDEVEELAK